MSVHGSSISPHRSNMHTKILFNNIHTSHKYKFPGRTLPCNTHNRIRLVGATLDEAYFA